MTFGDFGERIYGLKNANGQSYLVNSINKLKKQVAEQITMRLLVRQNLY